MAGVFTVHPATNGPLPEGISAVVTQENYTSFKAFVFEGLLVVAAGGSPEETDRRVAVALAEAEARARRRARCFRLK
jgi:hypothetical protein